MGVLQMWCIERSFFQKGSKKTDKDTILPYNSPEVTIIKLILHPSSPAGPGWPDPELQGAVPQQDAGQ